MHRLRDIGEDAEFELHLGDAMPIQAIHERWVGPHAAQAAAGLSRLKKAAEGAEKNIDA